MTAPKTHVSEAKKKTVQELSGLVKDKKTILLASIKGIPASQYQEIVKGLRGSAVVKVPKKNLILMALEKIKEKNIVSLKDKINNEDGFALLFSDLDAYELAGELVKSKSPAKAKAGQEAPEDIEVSEGPTELVPGPAISELGSLGIQIQIEKGKIHIKQSKVIVKKGDKIKQNAADIMAKLDIKPFSVGFTPLMAIDNKEKKVYAEIKINREEALANLLYAYSRALPFAVSVGYLSRDTIGFLLSKATAHANKINRIMTGEPEVVEEKQEEVQTETKKEEPAVDAGAGLASLFG